MNKEQGTIKIFFRRVVKIFLWVALSLLALIALLFVFFNLPGAPPREDVSFGVTFSSRFARDMGLDPKEALRAIFSDLGVRRIRLPVYWDDVERERGVFDFSDVDWQLDMARNFGADVIIAVGQKVPRWPECHISEWAVRNESLKNEAAARFIQATVDRYKNYPEISMWQIENEPFLAFGICSPLSGEMLDREIAVARRTDPSRPILTTDSGELSPWIFAAKRGDAFGTTLYRRIWNDRFGYVTYPIGPNFFQFKEFLTRIFTDQEHFLVIELQAEPWAPGSLLSVPLSEQWKTMDAEKFRDITRYARQVGFPEVYFWGAEWWYWLKEVKGDTSMWDAARDVFRVSR